MTEKQKAAIEILNIHRSEAKELTKEEYFALLDFVCGSTPQVEYIPFTRPENIPLVTYNQTE